jgi:hypothetical protein
MDPFTSFINSVVQLLGVYLDMVFFIPFVILAVVAVIFNENGPTKQNVVLLSYGAAALCAYLLVKLFRGTDTDAILLALIVCVVGLFMQFKAGGALSKLICGILAIAFISAIITYAAFAPPGSFLPQAINVIWGIPQAIMGAFNF